MTLCEETVTKIIATQAMREPGSIDLDTRLEDLALDSLAMVEVIFALEEAFDISVPFNANRPDQAAEDFASVGRIVSAVKDLIAQKAA